MNIFIQPLESRSLFSAIFVNGVLTITGTTGNDAINVAVGGGKVVANINGAASSFKHISRVVVNGGDGDDSIAIAVNVPALIHGNNGNDLLQGGGADDRIYGDAGNDQLYGGAGDDSLDGGAGSDLISGGDGRDTASYSSRTADLYVSVARGGYDDGEKSEHDNIRSDIEAILGGAGNDTLVGYTAADFISGGAGNDSITGDDGQDTLNGDDGNDSLFGNDNNDRLSGGNGDDYLEGGDGRNVLYGNDGDDYLNAHNNSTDDAVDGGNGRDYAKIDVSLFDGGDDRDNRKGIEKTKFYISDNRSDDDGFGF